MANDGIGTCGDQLVAVLYRVIPREESSERAIAEKTKAGPENGEDTARKPDRCDADTARGDTVR